VVELEDANVRLATVEAQMGAEVGDQLLPRHLDHALCRARALAR
jgi:hypothetical protein